MCYITRLQFTTILSVKYFYLIESCSVNVKLTNNVRLLKKNNYK